MVNKPYYTPMTLQDVEEFIHKMIKNNPDVDGTELVVGGRYVYDDNEDAPQGTIFLVLKKPSLDTDEDVFGTLVMMPLKTRNLQ